MNETLPPLVREVQHNCNVVDASHARSYSMCIYLLKMREYYRWEMGYGFQHPLSKQELGQWLVQRETLWETLEAEGFSDLSIDGHSYSPFDTADIERALAPSGLAYSGGLLGGGQPHFFLAERLRESNVDGVQVLITGKELARELSAPPAMLQGRRIYVRRESLQRMLWERLEEWQWHQRHTAMARAAAHYPFEADFNAALEAMTDVEIEAVTLHELWELQAGKRIGEDWGALLQRLGRSRAELMLRAARDHLADGLLTLPRLIETNQCASIHFYFANLHGMRRALFPELFAQYERWVEGAVGDTALVHWVTEGVGRWEDLIGSALAQYRQEQDAERLNIAVEALFGLDD